MRNLAWLLCGQLGLACTGSTVGPPLTNDGSGTVGATAASGSAAASGGSTGNGGGVSTATTSTGSTSGMGGAGGSATGSGDAAADRHTGADGPTGCARCESGCYQGLCNAALLRKGGALDEIAVQAAALDGDRLYFAIYAHSVTETIQVKSIPKPGGEETIVYDTTECQGCTPMSMTVDDANVYFFANQLTTKLLSVPKQGGAATPVTTFGTGWPLALTHDSTNLYWTDGAQFFSCPKTGGQPKPLSAYDGYVRRLAFFDNALVWVRKNPGQVQRLDLATGTPTLGNVGNSSPDLCDVAIDAGGVYWSECAFPYNVWTKDANGPRIVARASTNFQPIGKRDEYGSVATDGDSVYFLEYQLVDRIKKGAATAEPVAWTSEMPADPSAVFGHRIVGVDIGFVYLQATGTARLYRVPK